MTDWEPATEAEAALRDALRAGDQELYFRILSHVELLLPMSSAALSPRAGTGWGTWTSGGRTHVLAFTSPQAMTTCLAEHGGAARRMAYADLAGAWPIGLNDAAGSAGVRTGSGIPGRHAGAPGGGGGGVVGAGGGGVGAGGVGVRGGDVGARGGAIVRDGSTGRGGIAVNRRGSCSGSGSGAAWAGTRARPVGALRGGAASGA